MSTETIRLIRDGEMVEGGMVGERETIYLSYTVTTSMSPALRWAAMRVILLFY